MSQLERGGAYDPRRVNQAAPVQLTGVDRSLVPQQVITPPPVSRGAMLLEQLTQAIGASGQTAAEYNQVQRERAADQRRVDEQAKELFTGQGSLAGRTTLATLQDKIEKRDPTLAVPDGMPADEWAQQLADVYTKDRPDAFRAAFEREAVPGLVRSLTASQREQQSEHRDANFQLYESAAASAQSADELSQIVADARRLYPEVPEVDVYDKVLRPALFTAAQGGDAARVEMLKGELGEFLKPEQARADLALREAQDRREVDADRGFANDLGTLELSGASFDARRNFARAYQGVGDARKAATVDRINAQEREYQNQTRAEQTRQLKAAFDGAVLGAAREHAEGSAVTGGAYTINDAKIELPNGESHTYHSKDIVKDVVDAKFAEYDEKIKDPDANIRAKANFLADFGAPYEAWSKILDGGASSASARALTAAAEDGKTPRMPAALAAGLSLYEKLSDNPRLRDRLTTNEGARFFYSVTELAKTYVTGTDSATAILMAARATGDKDAWNESLSDRIPPQALDAAVKAVSTASDDHIPAWLGGGKPLGGFANENLVRRNVENLTRFAMSKALDLGPQQALDWATDKVRHSLVNLNGFAVQVQGRAVPGNISDVMPTLAADYAKANTQEVPDAGKLTLRPLGPNSWVLVDGATGLPVEKWREQGVFTDGDLFKRQMVTHGPPGYPESFGPVIGQAGPELLELSNRAAKDRLLKKYGLK